MSPAQWWDDPNPEFSVSSQVFHPDTMMSKQQVSRELLDDRSAPYRAEILRDAVDHAVLVVEREVYRATLPTGSETYPVEVVVPYHATVSVHLPRRWWERLLRRPRRAVTRDVGGTVHAVGHVRVDLEATFRYPELDSHGPAIPTGAAAGRPGPVRVDTVYTHPTHGPQGVHARRDLRCSPIVGGCGHHIVSHLTARHIDPGGCTIDGCGCQRQYPDADPWFG